MQDASYLPSRPIPSHSRATSRPHSYPHSQQQPAPTPSTRRYSISSQASQNPPSQTQSQYGARPLQDYPQSGYDSPAQQTTPPLHPQSQHDPRTPPPNHGSLPQQTAPQLQTQPPYNTAQERRPSHYTPLNSYTVPNDSPTETRRPKPILPPISPISLSRASPYTQFCNLIGIPAPPRSHPFYPAWKSTLYARITQQYYFKQWEYWFTAAFGNLLLLVQILISAVVTALGATRSPHLSITVLGAVGTVVAGLVTYMKSRGQPMRARTFRDELGRCIGAIEDAEAMFLGVSEGVDGYDVEDGEGGVEDDHEVTVRDEIERLTKMYESAVKNAQQNYPDLWAIAPDKQPDKKGKRGKAGRTGFSSNPTGVGSGRIRHSTGIKV